MIKLYNRDIGKIRYEGVEIVKVYDGAVQVFPPAIPEIPTGIDVVIEPISAIEWDFDNFYFGYGANSQNIRLYVKEGLIDTSTNPANTDFVLKVNNVQRDVNPVFNYPEYVSMNTFPAINPGDQVTISYTQGANPIKEDGTGDLLPNIVDQVLINAMVDWDYTRMFAGFEGNALALRPYFVNELIDITSKPENTDFEILINDRSESVVFYSMFEEFLQMQITGNILYGDVVKLSFTQGTIPFKAKTTGNLLPNISEVVMDNLMPAGNIEWFTEWFRLGENDDPNLITLYVKVDQLDITSVPSITDFVLSPFNALANVEVFTNRVELTTSNPYTASDEVLISYTPGVNPFKSVNDYLLTELSSQGLNNLLT